MENCRKPPGFSTRNASARRRSVSGTSMKLMKPVAKSKLASANGSSTALATRYSMPSGSSASARRACSMKISATSIAPIRAPRRASRRVL